MYRVYITTTQLYRSSDVANVGIAKFGFRVCFPIILDNGYERKILKNLLNSTCVADVRTVITGIGNMAVKIKDK